MACLEESVQVLLLDRFEHARGFRFITMKSTCVPDRHPFPISPEQQAHTGFEDECKIAFAPLERIVATPA